MVVRMGGCLLNFQEDHTVYHMYSGRPSGQYAGHVPNKLEVYPTDGTYIGR